MSAKRPKAIYGGADTPLRIGDIEIPCYVLDNGQRVIVASGLTQAIGLALGGAGRNRKGGLLPNFIRGPRIKPFVSKELLEGGEPIDFNLPKKGRAKGYDASVLAMVVEAVIMASDSGMLTKTYDNIVAQCRALYKGFARIGIIALIDEATGYQEFRNRTELHRLLEAYVSKELLPWSKTFPDEYYEQLFRLRDITYNEMSSKRPVIFSKDTADFVYLRLPPGVLDELRRKNPKNDRGNRTAKHHQFLTDDIGHPHLKSHLTAVIAIMRASKDLREFRILLDRAYPKKHSQLSLDITDDSS